MSAEHMAFALSFCSSFRHPFIPFSLSPGLKMWTKKPKECHNHKPQPTHDTKRKQKRQNQRVQNKQTHAQEDQIKVIYLLNNCLC